MGPRYVTWPGPRPTDAAGTKKKKKEKKNLTEPLRNSDHVLLPRRRRTTDTVERASAHDPTTPAIHAGAAVLPAAMDFVLI